MSRSNPRVNSLVRDALGEILQQRISDPRLQLVSITEVRTAPDHTRAEVLYSLVDPNVVHREGRGELPSAEQVAAGLAAATPRIRSLLGERVRLRRTPELVWHEDPLASSAGRLEDMLLRLRQEEE